MDADDAPAVLVRSIYVADLVQRLLYRVAGELVAEVAHAIEMGADAADIGLTIHAHPTLSETVGLAAAAFEGTITDLYLPKKR